ncbi:hypothetical protein D9611_012949 [Ephemerocybe angulata]|uniref:Ubiquitin-like domain-containing protein n=1 Tax=Ephemerocybe angulata TaxID=980116 RepID=A0A8H5C4C6_9AGAR|nr:hypothetical protein D9611_012949 [Tulosesus angulatus]
MPDTTGGIPCHSPVGASQSSENASGDPMCPPRWPQTQGPQMLLCNSSNFSVNGSTFNTILGNMVVNNFDYEEFLRRAVAELRRTLPAVVGYSSANALVITDALGETLTIPWSRVPTLSALSDYLVHHFRGKIGERRVIQGKYSIGRAEGKGGGRVVRHDEWEDIRGKNARLIMSMVIEKALVEELRTLCPKCGKTELGTYIDDGWQVCRRCNTRFMLPGKPIYRRRGRLTKDGDLVEEAAFRHVQKREVKEKLVEYKHGAGAPPAPAKMSGFIGKFKKIWGLQ